MRLARDSLVHTQRKCYNIYIASDFVFPTPREGNPPFSFCLCFFFLYLSTLFPAKSREAKKKGQVIVIVIVIPVVIDWCRSSFTILNLHYSYPDPHGPLTEN